MRNTPGAAREQGGMEEGRNQKHKSKIERNGLNSLL